MRKLVLLSFLVFSIISCKKEDTFPTPDVEGVKFTHSDGGQVAEIRFTNATKAEYWIKFDEAATLSKVLEGNYTIKESDVVLTWSNGQIILGHLTKSALYFSSDPPEINTLIKFNSSKNFSIPNQAPNMLSGTEWIGPLDPEDLSEMAQLLFVSNYQVNVNIIIEGGTSMKFGEFIYHLNGNQVKVDIGEEELLIGTINGNQFTSNVFEVPFEKVN